MGLPWGTDRPRGQGHNPLGSCPALVHVHSTVTVIGHFRIAFPKAQLEGIQTGCSIHQKGSLRAPGRLIPPHCKPRTSKARWDCSELWVISGFVLYHAFTSQEVSFTPGQLSMLEEAKNSPQAPSSTAPWGLIPPAPVLPCAQRPRAPRPAGPCPGHEDFSAARYKIYLCHM